MKTEVVKLVVTKDVIFLSSTLISSEFLHPQSGRDKIVIDWQTKQHRDYREKLAAATQKADSIEKKK